ncbi:hypothetical protein BH20ACT21_BH20ACT21_22330 [soil metagenome]
MSRVGHEPEFNRGELARSMVATTWAVGVPLAAGILFLALAAPENPPLYLHWLLTAAGALAAGALGARYQSNFSDLLVWNWVARIHAERRLATGTRLLDFDELLHSDRPDWTGELRPRHDLRILTKLASALEHKDLYTLGHSRRVARQACRIAAELGLTERELEELAEAAALHDVGKIRVPDAVLKKNGPLTIEEMAAVQEHPEVGARLVSALGRIQLTAAVLHHHESWDGSGYPRGLAGEAIPLFARVIAVADAHDAMSSDRPYRKGLSHERAMETLMEQSGRQFDPRVVAAFERCQQRHVVVPALIPLLLSGRRLLRTALSTGSAAAGSAGAAVTATALVIGLGLGPAPAPRIGPAPATAVAEVVTTRAETAGLPDFSRTPPFRERDRVKDRAQARPTPQPRMTPGSGDVQADDPPRAAAHTPLQPPGQTDPPSTAPAPQEPAPPPEGSVDRPEVGNPLPDLPDVPELPDVLDVPDLPDLPDVPDLPADRKDPEAREDSRDDRDGGDGRDGRHGRDDRDGRRRQGR